MKVKKYLLKAIVTALSVCLMVAFLCACDAADPVGLTITLEDGNHTYVIKNAESGTVSDILQQLGIELGTDDKISLSPDEKITADTTIEIQRKCNVTVINGEIEKTVTCVGGTVADALNLAKIKLKDTQTANYDMDEPLTDGMCICIIRKGAKKEETTAKSDKKSTNTEKETTKSAESSGGGNDTEYNDYREDYYSDDGYTGYNDRGSDTPSYDEPEQETERYEIDRQIIYDVGSTEHGVIIITYSDLTQEEIVF